MPCIQVKNENLPFTIGFLDQQEYETWTGRFAEIYEYLSFVIRENINVCGGKNLWKEKALLCQIK